MSYLVVLTILICVFLFAILLTMHLKLRTILGRSQSSIQFQKPSLGAIFNFNVFLKNGLTGGLQRIGFHPDQSHFWFFVGTSPRILVKDPEMIKEVIVNKENKFVRNTVSTEQLFRNGLIVSEGARWKKHRQLLSKAFTPRELDQSKETILKHANKLVLEWQQKKQPFKPIRDLSRMMLNILGEFSFGYDFDRSPLVGKSLHKALVSLTREAMIRHHSPVPYWRVYQRRSVQQALDTIDSIVHDIINHGKQQTAENNLLSLMLRSVDQGILTEEDVFDELVNFFIAGHETSATGLTWVLAILCKNPEIQERCFQEVKSVASTPEMIPDHLQELHYLENVVKESLRLYPPVPISTYRAEENTYLEGIYIPKDTVVDLLTILTHRDPKIWQNPEEFDPSRFDLSNAKQHHPYQYFPFLLGKHTCIGKILAMNEILISTALILSSFKLELQGELVEDIRISLHPSGFKIILSPRQEDG